MIGGVLLIIDENIAIWKLNKYHLSNTLQVNVPLSTKISTSRTVSWLPLCSNFNYTSVGYISRRALPNSMPSFKIQKMSTKQKVM